MHIEIWSDITCPYCYIGKRHLEQAIEQFEHEGIVDVTWHSFELDPGAETNTEQDIYELLASKYGQTREWAVKATEDLKDKATEVGIEFNPEKIIPTNSFDAHRLIKLAAEQNLADEAEEKLFAAYFTRGLHIGDTETLMDIGTDIGLDEAVVKKLLTGDDYAEEVRADEREAQQMGVRGVPFFLFNRKYAVSGAQPVPVFMKALNKSYGDEQSAAVD